MHSVSIENDALQLQRIIEAFEYILHLANQQFSDIAKADLLLGITLLCSMFLLYFWFYSLSEQAPKQSILINEVITDKVYLFSLLLG